MDLGYKCAHFVKTILVELNVFVTSLFIVRKVERKKSADYNRRLEHCTTIIEKRLTRLSSPYYHFN